jgi:hypothetical protein
MKPLTLQDIFTAGVKGVRAQGGPARGASGSSNGCAYRDPSNGFKCAIGHSIPDDKYISDIDRGICSLQALRECEVDVDPSVTLGQADGFQSCHDNAAMFGKSFMDAFETNIAEFAKQHNLVIPEKP